MADFRYICQILTYIYDFILLLQSLYDRQVMSSFLYIQKVLGIVMLEDGLTKIFLRSFILMHVIDEMSRVQPNSR